MQANAGNNIKKSIFILFGFLLFLNPAKGQDYYKLGLEEAGKDNYKKPIEYLTKSIDKSPTPAAYYNRGIAFGKSENNYEAISDFTKVIEVNPKAAFVFYNRGICYESLLKYEEAIADYAKVAETTTDFSYILYKRGRTNYELQNFPVSESLPAFQGTLV